MWAICARLSNKGKAGVQRGRETAGVPSFLPPRRAPRRPRRPQTANPPAEVQRKTSRPSGANPLTQFAHPGFPVQKRSRPLGANTLTQFEHPAQSVQKRSRPLGANTLTQFAHPGQPVQKIREIPKKFSCPKRRQNAHSHAEKTSIRTIQLAKPNHPKSGRKFLSKKCLTYRLGYANLYTWLAEAY